MVSRWQAGTLLIGLGSVGMLAISILYCLMYPLVGLFPPISRNWVAIMLAAISAILTEPIIIVAGISIAFSIVSIVRRYEWDTNLSLSVVLIILGAFVIVASIVLMVIGFQRMFIGLFSELLKLWP